VLSIRETKQIRVRQPLQRLIIEPGRVGTQDVVNRYSEHIREELNIKKLEFVNALNTLITHTFKPNNKTLGPRYGKNLKLVSDLIEQYGKESGPIFAKNIQNGKTISLSDTQGQTFELSPEDVIIETKCPDHLVFDDKTEPVFVLDTEITDELRREGFARDIVRHIQQLRKDSGLEIQDHIVIGWESDHADIIEAIGEHGSYIARETLGKQINRGVNGDVKEITLGKTAVLRLTVTKA
jgi:isoleucyl-tRNA synthetase